LHFNTRAIREQNVELLSVKPGELSGTCNNHWASRGRKNVSEYCNNYI